MNLRIKKPGFTLLEVLISASIFAIIGMLSTSIYINLSQNKQKIVSRNLIYDDAQFILDQLSREIASNTIDYEEYYNQLVLGGSPGMNFGHYAAQFYYNLKTNKAYEDCVDLSTNDGKKSCVNTGKNPANDFDPDGANAFYTSMTGDVAKTDKILCDTFLPSEVKSKYYACVQRLFLINGDGNTKIMIGREKLDWSDTAGGISHVLSQLVMNSYQDTSVSPPITIPRIFTCAISGSCTKNTTINNGSIINFTGASSAAVTYPSNSSGEEDLEVSIMEGVATTDNNQKPIARAYAKDFIPFTPSRVDIQNIKFFLSPAEDPHKAFAEGNSNGLQTDIHQPSVTIILTVQPISNVRYKTSYPSVTVQTTVTPGLFAEVQSFPPQMKKVP